MSTITVQANCTTNGTKTYTCSKCNDSYTEAIPATGQHNYIDEVTTTATCATNGVKTFTCHGCNDSYTETIPATGQHNYVDKITTVATCVTIGVKTFTCSVCKDSYTEAIDATGEHTYPYSIITTPPTCVKEGVSTKTCSVCNYSCTQTISPTGQHTYQREIITEPSCDTDGLEKYTCTECGDSYSMNLFPKGHKWQKANCQSPQTCSVCKEIMGEINPDNHTWVNATCKKPKTCCFCNTTVGSPVDHNYSGGVCRYCGTQHPYHSKIKNYIYKNGSYSSQTGSYSAIYYSIVDTAHFVAVKYGEISLSTMTTFASETYLFTVDLNSNFSGTYEWTLSDTSGRIMYGKFDASTFKSGTKLSYTNTNVSSSLCQSYLNLASSMLSTTISSIDFKLKPKTGVSAYQMGFTAY